jgi:cytochrome b
MTDVASSRLPPTGQALPYWDPLLRLAHWGIAVVVIANYAFTKEGGSVHIAFGWAGLAILILRLIWGFVGPMEARFSSFPPNPMAALRHLGRMLRGAAPHYPSHNPAGALMAYALWACLGVITLTGLGMSGLSPFAQAELEAAVADGDWSVLVEEDGDAEGESESLYGDVLEEVHEVAANLIVILAFLHVAGVVVESRVLRRNLVAPMLMARRGRKG